MGHTSLSLKNILMMASSESPAIKLFGKTISQTQDNQSSTDQSPTSSASSEDAASTAAASAAAAAAASRSPLPCPRCKSKETKFCYFNNYNVNQPRHFCKSCLRYWTAGGVLRNVPVGAGRRKNHRPPPAAEAASSRSGDGEVERWIS